MIWTTDVTGVIMLLTIKMTSYDYSPESSDKKPRFVEWFGYAYFFPSFLTGPTITFKEYQEFITKKPKDIYSLKEAFYDTYDPILKALFTLGFVFMTKKVPIIYSLTNEFGEWSILNRIGYMYVAIFCLRCKYYFAWFLAEANCRMIGLTEKQSRNINILHIELGENVREVLSNWNICTANWLKNSVYKPLTRNNYSATTATYITNFVSAFWHGFYPGYYFTFLFGGIMTKLGRDFYHYVWPKFKDTIFEYPYRLFSILTVILLLIFGGTPFQIYGFNDTLVFYRNINYIGFIIIGLGFLIVRVLRIKKKEN